MMSVNLAHHEARDETEWAFRLISITFRGADNTLMRQRADVRDFVGRNYSNVFLSRGSADVSR